MVGKSITIFIFVCDFFKYYYFYFLWGDIFNDITNKNKEHVGRLVTYQDLGKIFTLYDAK